MIEKIKRYKMKMNTISDMEKSRNYFILEGITGIGHFSLTTGAFLSGFVSFLGGAQQLNGTLGVVPAAMGILQVFSTLLIRENKSRKHLAIQIALFLRIFLSSVYFVPFIVQGLGAPKNIVILSFISCFVMAFGLNGIIAPLISGWLVDVTPIHIRGQYLAAREKISLAVVGICTIGLGWVLDFFEAKGNEFFGFLVVGLVLVIMGILNIYALVHIHDVPASEPMRKDSFLKRLKEPLFDKVFIKIILLYIVWNFALNIGGPYISVYMVEYLDLSYTYMMSMTVITIIIRVLFTSRWGKFADRKSWFHCGALSLIALAITHFLWGFVNSSNYRIFIPLLNVAGGISWAGVGISLFNIQFLFAKKEIRTLSIGLNAAIGGIISIVAVNIGGFLINQLKGVVIPMPFHQSIQGIQLTFILSGLIIGVCPLIIFFVLRKYAQHITDK